MLSAFSDKPSPRRLSNQAKLVIQLFVCGLLILCVGLSLLMAVTVCFDSPARTPFKGRYQEHNKYWHGLMEAKPRKTLDAVILLAMGESYVLGKAGVVTDTDAMIEAFICTLRTTGQYKGEIYIYTDHAEKFKHLADSTHGQAPVLRELPKAPSIRHVWFLKCRILEMLPHHHSTVLYMDSDILVTQPISNLMREVPQFTDTFIGMFHDITTRYGNIREGDNYHGGVVVLQRNASESCMRGWCAIMEFGSAEQSSSSSAPMWTSTSVAGASPSAAVMDDQEAMRLAVEQDGVCRAWFIPDKFLQFAADKPSLMLTPARMLMHVTHAARDRLQGPWRWLWRWFVFKGVSQECVRSVEHAYLP